MHPASSLIPIEGDSIIKGIVMKKALLAAVIVLGMVVMVGCEKDENKSNEDETGMTPQQVLEKLLDEYYAGLGDDIRSSSDVTMTLSLGFDAPDMPAGFPSTMQISFDGTILMLSDESEFSFILDAPDVYAFIEQAISESGSGDEQMAEYFTQAQFEDIDIKCKIIDDTLYIASGKLLGDGWYSMSIDDIGDMVGDDAGIDFGQMFHQLQTATGSMQTTNLYQGTLRDVEEIDGEQVNDMETRGFSVSLDYNQLMRNTIDMYQDMDIGIDASTIEDQMESYRDMYDTYNVSFWFGRDDGKLYRLTQDIRGAMDQEELSMDLGIVTDAAYRYDIDQDTIEIPSDAIPIKEINLDDIPEDSLVRIIFYNLSMATVKARDAHRKSDFANVRTALEMYYQDQNFKYPVVSSYGDLEEVLDEYFRTGNYPSDPSVEGNYGYAATDDGEAYVLGGWLESQDEFYVVYSAQDDVAQSVKDALVSEIKGESPFDYTLLESWGGDSNSTTIVTGKAKDAVIKSDLANVRTALEMYYQDNTYAYPDVASYAALETALEQYFAAGNFPYNTEDKENYYYEAEDDGQGYVLGATLSDGSNYEVANAQ
jgi:hypothetical protein